MKKTMYHRFAFWFTIRPVILLAAISAVVSYILIELLLRKVPELFPGAAAIGDMVVGVSLSVIAAFIFYVVDIHVKEHFTRKRVHRYIAPRLKEVLLTGLGFVHSLDSRRSLNGQMFRHYKVTDLIRVLKWYDSTDTHARYKVEQNYRARAASISTAIDDILVHYAGLDPHLIDILQGIKRSYMFLRIENFDTEEELTTMAEPLLEILYRFRDLHRYMTKHIPDYLEEENHPDFTMYERYQSVRREQRAQRRRNKTEP